MNSRLKNAAPSANGIPEPAVARPSARQLARVRAQRAEACLAALDAVLKEHRCALDIAVELRAGQVVPKLSVLPQD